MTLGVYLWSVNRPFNQTNSLNRVGYHTRNNIFHIRADSCGPTKQIAAWPLASGPILSCPLLLDHQSPDGKRVSEALEDVKPPAALDGDPLLMGSRIGLISDVADVEWYLRQSLLLTFAVGSGTVSDADVDTCRLRNAAPSSCRLVSISARKRQFRKGKLIVAGGKWQGRTATGNKRATLKDVSRCPIPDFPIFPDWTRGLGGGFDIENAGLVWGSSEMCPRAPMPVFI